MSPENVQTELDDFVKYISVTLTVRSQVAADEWGICVRKI